MRAARGDDVRDGAVCVCVYVWGHSGLTCDTGGWLAPPWTRCAAGGGSCGAPAVGSR